MLNRKEVDNFLLALEKYLIDNNLEEHEAMDLLVIFREAWKPTLNTLWANKRVVELPRLAYLLNWNRANCYSKRSNWLLIKRPTVKATGITSHYIRRLAYKMKWIEINEIDYIHFFRKVMFFTSDITELKLNYTEEGWLLKHKLKKLLVPEDLYHSLDLCLFENSIN